MNWAPLAEDDPLPGDPQGVAQLVSLLGGDSIYVSDPLPGKTHDKTALRMTSARAG